MKYAWLIRIEYQTCEEKLLHISFKIDIFTMTVYLFDVNKYLVEYIFI